MTEKLQIRIHGSSVLPVLVYLPGLHGDWTLVSGFRSAVANRVRFVEFTYPRTTTWSIGNYAQAVNESLLANGVARGWLLAESFGSLVAWEMIAQGNSTPPTGSELTRSSFSATGLVLAGGFVRHPMPWGARLLRKSGGGLPMSVYRRLIGSYVRYAKFLHCRCPEVLAGLDEFAARRTELDREAMRARLELVVNADPRPSARRTTLPVYHLGGFADPIVPNPLVRPWLRQNCPGFRGAKTCWLADHVVLTSATRRSAEAVLGWMKGACGSGAV